MSPPHQPGSQPGSSVNQQRLWARVPIPAGAGEANQPPPAAWAPGPSTKITPAWWLREGQRPKTPGQGGVGTEKPQGSLCHLPLGSPGPPPRSHGPPPSQVHSLPPLPALCTQAASQPLRLIPEVTVTSVSASSPRPQASQGLTWQSPRVCATAAASHAPMTADPAVWALTQTGIPTLLAVGPLSGPSHCLTMQCPTSWRDGLGRLGFSRLRSFKNTCLGAASSPQPPGPPRPSGQKVGFSRFWGPDAPP